MINGREPNLLYQYFNKEQKGWELETDVNDVYKDFKIGNHHKSTSHRGLRTVGSSANSRKIFLIATLL